MSTDFNALAIFAPHTAPESLVSPPAVPLHAAAPATSWVPTFLSGVTVNVPGVGQIRENPYYFATPETADYLVRRFGLMGAVPVTIDYGAGYAISAPQECVMLPDGRLYNAGQLAWYFIQYPEQELPGVAAQLVATAIRNLLAKPNNSELINAPKP